MTSQQPQGVKALIEAALADLPANADSPWTNLDKMPYIHQTDDPKASPWNCPVVGRFDYLQTMQYMLALQPANVRALLADHATELSTLSLRLAEAEKREQGLRDELNSFGATEAGLNSSVLHLSGLVDFERQVSQRCMAVMKALMNTATPIEGEDMDCHIPGADYADFVNAHAEILYVIANGKRPDAALNNETTGKPEQGEKK